MKFHAAIQNIVTQSVREAAHPIQGYIPKDSVDWKQRTCTVRVPNPKGATHPAQGADQNYVEFRGVPMPFSGGGILTAIGNIVFNRDRGVLIGFKGGNQAHPYIISFLSFFHNETDREEQNTRHRGSAVARRFNSAAPLAGAAVGPTAARINATALPPAGSNTPVRVAPSPLNRPVASRTSIERFVTQQADKTRAALDRVLTRPVNVRITPRR